MTGADVLRLAKGRKGDWLATNGQGLLVSGTLLVRWIKTFKDPASLAVVWTATALIVARPGARLILTSAMGPCPKADKTRGPAPGTVEARKRSDVAAKKFARDIAHLRADALLLPNNA